MTSDMNKARIVIIIGIIAIIAVAVFGGTWFFFTKDKAVPVSWDVASMLLQEGNVLTVMRTSEGIYFVVDTERTIISQEPYENALESELSKCGEKCSRTEYIRQ